MWSPLIAQIRHADEIVRTGVVRNSSVYPAWLWLSVARRCGAWLAIGALLAGCRQEAKRPAGGAAPSAVVSAAATNELAEAERLARAATHQNTLLDRQIVVMARASVTYSKNPEVWIELGRAWIRKARESSDPGYYLNAEACAKLALARSPNSEFALNLKAMVRLNQHRFAEARDLAQASLAQSADEVTALGLLSDAQLELGETEQALAAAERMVWLKPNLPSYSRISYFAWLKGQTPAALESIRRAIDAGGARADAEPRAWALVQGGLLFWHRADYAGADAGFEQALEVIASYPPALVGRGRVALATGDAGRAAGLFREALLRAPLVETADLLNQALIRAGDSAGAEAAFKDAEREGRRGDARSLSLLYSTRGVNVEEALRLAREERQHRADIYTEDALAFALYRAGKFAEARTRSALAMRYGTEDARLMFHHGAILLATGEAVEGRRTLTRALALNPHFDVLGAAEARRLLEVPDRLVKR